MFNDEVIADNKSAVFDASSVVSQARQLNMLAALAIPHIMAFLFPPMYIYFWERCRELVTQNSGFPKLALGIPRGHAKTLFLKLLILYIILFTKRRFILIICAKGDLAESIISDVCDMLSHSNIRTLFGRWDEALEIDRQDSKRFSFRGRTIILKGVGQGASFRGIAEKMARPDVMIFDDAQTRECASSITQATQFIEWFRGTALKAKDPKFCFYLYVGNIYPKLEISPAVGDQQAVYGCMLKNLKLSTYWESIIVGGLLADGTALWEELQPRSQLLAEYKEDCAAGMEHIFLAEVMNDDEAINTGLFDETKVPIFPFTDNVIEQGSCLIIDPSLGRTKSDDQMVGHMKVIDGRCVLWNIKRFQVSAPNLVRSLIDWCLAENIPAIVIESYAYQASLGQWFEEILEDMGIVGIEILLISRGRQSKNSAIRSMCKELETGDLLLHPQARSLIYSEIRTFDPMRGDNKDNALDVASYCNIVKLTFPREIQCNLLLTMGIDADWSPDVIDIGMQHG